MRVLAEALAAAEATRGRKAKVEALASALRAIAEREPSRLPFAARFLTGAMLPVSDERTLGAGAALVSEAAAAVCGISLEDLERAARRAGDLGTAVGEAVLAATAAGTHPGTGLRLADAEALAEALAETSIRAEKGRALRDALAASTAVEARYLIRAVLGEMRVGAKGGIVEEAIARAWDRAPGAVRRAAGLVVDVGELATLAQKDRLGEAQVVLGRPVAFMLATPIETARGKELSRPHTVEDKIDGIRAQVHVSPEGVTIFARGKGPVTAAFPDLVEPLRVAALGGLEPAILDGEIVVMGEGGRPRPFSALQPRLRKTAPDAPLLAALPVRYLAYDLLYEEGEPLLDLPFTARRARLERWAARAPGPVVVHASRRLAAEGTAQSGNAEDAVDREFAAARARGFEGLVLKRDDAPYTAGVRGFAWLKVKKALATLDVVLVAAERGHGRRAGVLSDYTFAVRNGERLEVVGKAYSGLTDEEIRAMTERLLVLADGEERHGYLEVRPEIVLEVAFDGLQRSQRHASGFALRFPRIARVREDKTAADADTIETVRALYEAQLKSGHREDVTAEDRKKSTIVRKGGRRSGRRPDLRQKAKQLKLFDDE
jgi:DNA ligase 1